MSLEKPKEKRTEREIKGEINFKIRNQRLKKKTRICGVKNIKWGKNPRDLCSINFLNITMNMKIMSENWVDGRQESFQRLVQLKAVGYISN